MPFFKSASLQGIFEARQFKNDESTPEIVRWANSFLYQKSRSFDNSFVAWVRDSIVVPGNRGASSAPAGSWLVIDGNIIRLLSNENFEKQYKPTNENDGPFRVANDDSGHDYIIRVADKEAFDRWVSDTASYLDTGVDFDHCRVNLSSLVFPSYSI